MIYPTAISNRILTLLAALALPASAARLAYEGFDYPQTDGTSINGLNGGTGWDEAFPAPGGTIVLRPGLTYTGLDTVGKAMRWSPNASLGEGRDWGGLNPTTPPDNGTYWFSVIVNASGSAQGNFNWMFSSKSTTGQNGIGFRISNDGSGNLNFKPVHPNTDGSGEAQAGTGTAGTPTFIVGRLNLSAGSNSNFRIWINPSTDPGVIPSDSSPNSSLAIVNANDTATLRSAITGRAFGTDSGAGPNFLEYDEIRIATTFAEVLPPQPGVIEFNLDPLTAIENQTLTLGWSNLPAASNPTLNGIPVTIDGSGNGNTTLPAPAVNTTYTLAWTGAGSPLTQEFTALAPSFAISPAAGYLGDTLTLNWQIPVGSTSVTMDPGAVDLTGLTDEANGTGSITLPAPTSTTLYTISYDSGGVSDIQSTFTLLPSFLKVTPSSVLENANLAISWRISPAWNDNALPEDNELTLQSAASPDFVNDLYDEIDVRFNTNGVTGAGFYNNLDAVADLTYFRLVYKIDGVETILSDTITIFPRVFELDSVSGNSGSVVVNSEPMFDGVLAYGDRTHVWAAVPSIMQGAQFIKLTQADRPSANLQINLTAERDGTFFLLIDNRVGDGIGGNNPASGTNNPPTLGNGVMDWVLTSGFVDSGVDIGLDENPVASGVSIDQSYSVFFRQVSEGETITFYEQNDGLERNMYGIAAVSPQVTPVAFAVNPSAINQGENTLLQWTVPTGFTSVILNPGNIDVTSNTDSLTGVGNITLTPAATIEYTLTYTLGANAPVVLSPVTVVVTAAPPEPTTFSISSVSVAGNGHVSFSWPAPAGVTDPLALTDVIERSTTLEALSWVDITSTGTLSIIDGIVSFVDSVPPVGGKAFYRIARP